MARITKKYKEKIEKVREKKQKTIEKVKGMLKDICESNKEIFKKAPEGRVKELEKIVKRIKSITGCNINNFEKHIRDIAGVRITCCTSDEIPRAVDFIKKHADVKSCKTLREYEKRGEDGYRGHHLEVTVKIFYKNKNIKDICEVQIRTLAMDLWAVLSHRDFYKAPSKPPPLVQRDMVTLGKLLEATDEFALSLKYRMREATDREIREKSTKKGTTTKDMLTPENFQKLVLDIFKEKISIDFAYELIQYVLVYGEITSLKEYKSLITNTEYRGIIERIFKAVGVNPAIESYLCGPVSLEVEDRESAEETLTEAAKELRQEREEEFQAVEKGKEISKEELRLEKKISQPSEEEKK